MFRGSVLPDVLTLGEKFSRAAVGQVRLQHVVAMRKVPRSSTFRSLPASLGVIAGFRTPRTAPGGIAIRPVVSGGGRPKMRLGSTCAATALPTLPNLLNDTRRRGFLRKFTELFLVGMYVGERLALHVFEQLVEPEEHGKEERTRAERLVVPWQRQRAGARSEQYLEGVGVGVDEERPVAVVVPAKELRLEVGRRALERAPRRDRRVPPTSMTTRPFGAWSGRGQRRVLDARLLGRRRRRRRVGSRRALHDSAAAVARAARCSAACCGVDRSHCASFPSPCFGSDGVAAVSQKLAAASMLTLLSFSFGAPTTRPTTAADARPGVCFGGKCKCESGWRGADCSLKACAATKLGDDGAGGAAGTGSASPTGRAVRRRLRPSARGTAPRRTTAAAACAPPTAAPPRSAGTATRGRANSRACPAGRGRIARALCPNACSGHGKCAVDMASRCVCEAGWGGDDCATAACATARGAACASTRSAAASARSPGGTASSAAAPTTSFRGRCVQSPSGGPPCACAAGASGPTCAARRARRAARTTARASTARRARATPAGRATLRDADVRRRAQ